MKNKKLLLSMLFLLSLIFLASCRAPQPTPHGGPIDRPLYVLKDPSIGPWDSTHEHTAFLIFINGNVLDLSKPEYMVRARRVHIEGLDGIIIHKHATGITIGHFLETLGMGFDENCFVDDKGNSYCNNDDKNLKFYVNEKLNNDFDNYIIKDNDRLLISYGNEDDVNGQLNFLNSIKIGP
ncbi:MAG: protein-disulfide isomerase [Nanoarchaeota archaeon]|nr:protein-disulfide isomerase [Nanoarchaeota archaeon]